MSSLAGATTGGAVLARLVLADPSPGAGRAPPSPGLHLLAASSSLDLGRKYSSDRVAFWVNFLNSLSVGSMAVSRNRNGSLKGGVQ